jgi:hypothetical protein
LISSLFETKKMAQNPEPGRFVVVTSRRAGEGLPPEHHLHISVEDETKPGKHIVLVLTFKVFFI